MYRIWKVIFWSRINNGYFFQFDYTCEYPLTQKFGLAACCKCVPPALFDSKLIFQAKFFWQSVLVSAPAAELLPKPEGNPRVICGMEEKPVPESAEDKIISEVWHTYLTSGAKVRGMHLPWFEHPALKPVFRALPAEPRCQMCYIPFNGIGGFISKRLLAVKPSPMNPHICDVCERFAARFPGGTELEVSILFADIRGSTPLAERMENRAFSELIQRFYVAGTKALYSNNALIEKFDGDGLNAFFAPAFAGPNHALTAINAGKEILRATGHGEGKTPWVPVGVGVNTGVAFIGALKVEGGRTDITILGDAVNTTARLSSQAGTGELLVGERTMEMSELSMEEHESRDLPLKGKEEPVKAWSINTSE
jgi:adenylate cyclase